MKINIQKIVTSYVASPETNGAILISGPWGIGKSFYWRETLKPCIEKIPIGSKGKKYKCLYVSLNGISDTREIMEQLLLEKIPILKKKIVNVSGKIAPGILKGVAASTGFSKAWNYVSSLWAKGVRLDEFMSFENFVLCFDDLERNNAQEKILGFINTYFVEKRNCKVILIGDESKINEDGSPYHKIKEKLIFRIVQFDPVLVGLPDLMKKYEGDAFWKALSNYSDYLIGLQAELGNRNLRTWIFILDCLNQVFSEFPSIVDDKNKELAKSTIFFTVVISIDFKAGLLQSHEAGDFKSLDRLVGDNYTQLLSESFANHRRNQQKEGDDERIAARYEMTFYERNHISNHTEYYFFPSVYKFVLTGEFDTSAFQNGLKDFEAFLINRDQDKTSERIAMQAMQRANWIKTDEELSKHFETFLSHATAGDYAFYNYGWMYDLIMGWIDDKLLHMEQTVLEKIFVEGCMKARERNEHDWPFISQEENARYTKTRSISLGNIITNGINDLVQVDVDNKRQQFIAALKDDSSYFRENYFYTDPFSFMSSDELFNLVTRELPAMKNLNSYFASLLKSGNVGITYRYADPLKEFHGKLKAWYKPDEAGLFIHFSKFILWQCAEIEKEITETKNQTE